jgi:hypothetical protein
MERVDMIAHLAFEPAMQRLRQDRPFKNLASRS